MSHAGAVLLCTLSLTVLASAQVSQVPSSVLRTFDVQVVDVQDLALPPFSGAPFSFTIMLDGRSRTVQCHPHSLRSARFKLWVDGPLGLAHEPAPAPCTYRGEVVGSAESLVAVSLIDGSLTGVLRVDGHLFGVQPLRVSDPSAPATRHVVYDSQQNAAVPGTCLELPIPGAPVWTPPAVLPDGSGVLKTAEIAFDCDFQFYQDNGNNLTATINDTEAVMNGVDVIYLADVNITHSIVDIIVRTSSGSNPYSTNSASGLLTQFQSHWNANHTNIQRDITHLMTGRNLSGSTIGIAYLAAICSSVNHYGLSERYTSNMTLRLALTAHELGHNWGANHCSGSGCWIMCPSIGGCGGVLSAFSPGSVNAILGFKATRTCLTCPTTPTLPFVTSLVRSPVRIDASTSSPGSDPGGLSLATQGSTVVTTWAERGGSAVNPRDIWAAASVDEGRSFQPAQRIDLGDPAHGSDAKFPKAVVCDNGAVVCVWEDSRAFAGRDDVFSNRSANGTSWNSSPLPLNSTTAGAHVTSDVDSVRIARSGNTVYVCWLEDSLSSLGSARELKFTRSIDAGLNWSAPVVLNSQIPGHSNGIWPHNDASDPFLVAQGDRVVLAYVDDRQTSAGTNQPDVWVLVSQNRGQSFTDFSLESDTNGSVNSPSADLDGANITIAWRDGGAGQGDAIHAASSVNGGLSFGPETTLSAAAEAHPVAVATTPSVAVVGTRAYVAWCDDHVSLMMSGPGGAAGNKAYLAISFTLGSSWLLDQPLDPSDPRPNNGVVIRATQDSVYAAMDVGVPGAQMAAFAWSREGVFFGPLELVNAGGTDSDLPDVKESTPFVLTATSDIGLLAYRDLLPSGREPHVAALRTPFVKFEGNPQLGQDVRIGVSGTPPSSLFGASFLIGISGTGTSPATATPVGLMHLVPDAFTLIGLTEPSILALLQGNILGDGAGVGPIFPWPLPSGAPDLHMVGAVFLGSLIHLTEPLTIVSQ